MAQRYSTEAKNPQGEQKNSMVTGGSLNDDKFGILLDILLVGGWRALATETDRDAIPVSGSMDTSNSSGARRRGMRVYCWETDKEYYQNITTAAWNALTTDTQRIAMLADNTLWTEVPKGGGAGLKTYTGTNASQMVAQPGIFYFVGNKLYEFVGTQPTAKGDFSGSDTDFVLRLNGDAGDPNGGSVAWADITGKPSTFPPSVHTHTIADVTSLQSTLNNKSDTSHTHSEATTAVAGFLSAADKLKLDNLKTTNTPAGGPLPYNSATLYGQNDVAYYDTPDGYSGGTRLFMWTVAGTAATRATPLTTANVTNTGWSEVSSSLSGTLYADLGQNTNGGMNQQAVTNLFSPSLPRPTLPAHVNQVVTLNINAGKLVDATLDKPIQLSYSLALSVTLLPGCFLSVPITAVGAARAVTVPSNYDTMVTGSLRTMTIDTGKTARVLFENLDGVISFGFLK